MKSGLRCVIWNSPQKASFESTNFTDIMRLFFIFTSNFKDFRRFVRTMEIRSKNAAWQVTWLNQRQKNKNLQSKISLQ